MTTTHRLLILLIVVVAAGFLYLGLRSDSSDVTTTNKTVNKDFRELEMLSSAGHKVFQSENYDFTYTIDHGVDWSVSEAAEPTLLTTWFSLPNPNSEEEERDDIPNGFNTFEKNSFRLDVYPNSGSVSPNGEAELKDCLKNDLNSEYIPGSFLTLSIARNRLFKVVDFQGIDVREAHYYLFGSAFVYVFSSGDFTEQEMREFISGFTYERAPL